MSIDTDHTPDDPTSLKALVASQRSEIERLHLLVAKLQRLYFGRRAETFTVSSEQLALALEGAPKAPAAPSHPTLGGEPQRCRPTRKPLPAHLPRETEVHTLVQAGCPDCGGQLRAIGEDVTEVLEYVPARFKVIRHVRPKQICGCCNRLVQAPAPQRPIARGMAGPCLLAQVLVAKYCDHLPL